MLGDYWYRLIMFQPIIQEDFLDSYYFEYLDNWVHSFDIEWRFNNNISGKWCKFFEIFNIFVKNGPPKTAIFLRKYWHFWIFDQNLAISTKIGRFLIKNGRFLIKNGRFLIKNWSNFDRYAYSAFYGTALQEDGARPDAHGGLPLWQRDWGPDKFWKFVDQNLINFWSENWF